MELSNSIKLKNECWGNVCDNTCRAVVDDFIRDAREDGVAAADLRCYQCMDQHLCALLREEMLTDAAQIIGEMNICID